MAVRGEASIVIIKMPVNKCFWRRVKVVYGIGEAGEGRLGGSEGLASCGQLWGEMASSGAKFAVLTSAILATSWTTKYDGSLLIG